MNINTRILRLILEVVLNHYDHYTQINEDRISNFDEAVDQKIDKWDDELKEIKKEIK